MFRFIQFAVYNLAPIPPHGVSILDVSGTAWGDDTFGGSISPMVLGGIARHLLALLFIPSLLGVGV